MSKKSECFLICVTIIEGRHYAITNMDSVVLLRIGNFRKITNIQQSSDCPFYNEYFVFEVDTNLEQLLDTSLCVTVMQPRKFFSSRQILGYFNLELSVVWAQTDHQFFHKWAILTTPSENKPGPKGYLKMDISILTKGQTPHFSASADQSDDIEGNLLLPENISYDRPRAHFVFNIYRAEDLPKMKPSLLKPSLVLDSANTLPNTYVQITFAGHTARTNICKRTQNPVWNQRITFTDLFPPLCQRIKIELKFGHQQNLDLKHYINLKSIMCDGELGFLPTFGPLHIYLYNSKGDGDYSGKLLIDFNTEIINDLMWSSASSVVQPIRQLPNLALWNLKTVLIFCAIHSVTMIDKKYMNKRVSFELTMGNKANGSSVTLPVKLATDGQFYSYIPCSGNISCLSALSVWPDARSRAFNSNMIRKIYGALEDLEQSTTTLLLSKNRKRLFRRLKKILERLFRLTEEPQGFWPDTFIWMKVNNKRVASYKVLAFEILYSEIEEQRGSLCGILHNVYLKALNSTKTHIDTRVSCKLSLQLWAGLQSEQSQCFKLFRNVCKPFDIETDGIPSYLTFKERHRFRCNVYVYQGRFQPGADDTGLADFFVLASVNGQVQITKSIPESIQPVWDQTLTFNDLTLYGPLDFIKSNTPIIELEVYDQDSMFITVQNEFLGRSSVLPQLNLDKSKLVNKLSWINVYNGQSIVGEILIAAELILADDERKFYLVYDNVPENIKPKMDSFRLDVYFWGVRDLKKIGFTTIKKPKITIECGNKTIHSTTLQNATKYLNFKSPYQFTDINISKEEEYYPPLSIKMYDYHGFGWYDFCGVYIGNVRDFIYKPLKKSERIALLSEGNNMLLESSSSSESSGKLESKKLENNKRLFFRLLSKLFSKTRTKRKRKFSNQEMPELDLNYVDWWTKFYTSLQDKSLKDNLESLKIKIYGNELELQPEFNNFEDFLKTFQIYRGKKTGDEFLDEENISGVFKGAIRIYKWPQSEQENDTNEYVNEVGLFLQEGSFQHYPSNEPISFVIRVYIICALNLRPKDLSGKSDPYVVIKMGDKVINDKERYVPNQVNPIFGRCYELNGVLPFDNLLIISIWDWDLSTSDDLIGETKVDVEKRMYTNHRATCGLAFEYYNHGPCAWRDPQKPSQILEFLCRKYRIGEPEYSEKFVKVGSNIFTSNKPVHPDSKLYKEVLSLNVLHNWKQIPIVGCYLVPEHVETRSLYHPNKPGLEQGKLQMWIDIFPSGDMPPPPVVDITPRLPVPYELRVIIWNTKDVVLQEDDFFIGEKKSDIYVKSWLTDIEDSQCTDVHYNSISGEGNFNWRFIYRFDYLPVEDRIVLYKNQSFFIQEQTEQKIPCKLALQVWDNDTFSVDDFIGSLTLNLSKLPRGAKTAKLCSLGILEPKAPVVNLFKTKRHRGWWPFTNVASNANHFILTGKVEAELHLLTGEEARMCPAGLGRSEPQALPEPKRPDISFSWFWNPLRALKFLVCKRFRCKMILGLLIVLLIFMVLIGIYSFPNYLVKKLLGA